jgi:single-strand DNA-binding protein
VIELSTTCRQPAHTAITCGNVDLVSFHPNSQHIDRLSTPKESVMDNVVVGNLCQDPILRQPFRGSKPYAKFTVAVNSRYRVGDEYVDRPTVFHRVVCFGPLAENVSNSLRKGMEVLAVGEWADDSYTDEQGQRRVQVVMQARTLGPTLRWATADVNRTERAPDNNAIDVFAAENTRQPTAQPAQPTQSTAVPVPETPAAGLSVIRGLPTPTPDADARGSTRRRKKVEPESAIPRAG